VFRLACTVQPKARPAVDAATVAGSGLTGTPARPKNAPDADTDSAGVPDRMEHPPYAARIGAGRMRHFLSTASPAGQAE